jgi:hypothetical protein
MRLDEVQRSRVFLRTAFALCVLGALLSMFSGGDPTAQRIVIGGSLLAGVGAIWTIGIVGDVAYYQPSRLIVPGLLLVVGAMTGVYYWGIASPVA